MEKVIKQLSPLTESTYYILLALEQERHGYGIIKLIQELTNGRLTLAAGTLYGAIQNLLKYNCIRQVGETGASRGKKTYLITSVGKKLLDHEIERLKEMLKHSETIGVIR